MRHCKRYSLLSLVVVAVLLLMTMGSYAESRNPDKVPSMGISFITTQTEGTKTFDLTPVSLGILSQVATEKVNSLQVDLRVPVTDNITVSLFGGPVWKTLEDHYGESAVALATADSLKTTGKNLGAGVRYYFQ